MLTHRTLQLRMKPIACLSVAVMALCGGPAIFAQDAADSRGGGGGGGSSAAKLIRGPVEPMQEAIVGNPPTAKFYLTPIPAQGTLGAYPSGTMISGNTLYLTHYSDFTAYFNVQVEDWDPLGNGPLLTTLQARVDASDYLGANATPSNSGVNLTRSTPACSLNTQCTTFFGEPGSRCNNAFPGACNNAFQNETRSDGWDEPLPSGCSSGALWAVDAGNSAGPLFGGTVSDPLTCSMPDPGTRRYLGTLALKIPWNATSTYTIGFVMGPETFLDAPNFVSIPIAQVVPAVVQRWRMNRYLELQPLPVLPPPLNGPVYIGVQLAYIAGFPAFNGQTRYVGVPQVFPNESGSPTTFKSSHLQCTPAVLPQSNFDGVYLRGSEVVPNSVYLIIVALASGQVIQSYTLQTAKWGDVYPPFYVAGGDPQPDFADVSALVDKFKGASGAVHKAIGQLQPNDPNPTDALNFSDVSACVDAFKGSGYPYSGPVACP